MTPERRSQTWGPDTRGFTLLEVMVALAIAALSLAAISLSNAKAVQNSVKVYRMTSASMLMRGLVLDIEEEYQLDGFPENDQTTRDCDVPRPFDKTFECEYDLERMQFEAGELESLSSAALSGVMGGMDMAGLMGGGARKDPSQLQSMIDPTMLPALAVLFGPEGDQLLNMCSINLGNVLMSVMGISQFFPKIVEKAAEQTRKLTVRLTWEEGHRLDRELVVETFIVAIPEEQQELMKLLGRAAEDGGDLGGGLLPGLGGGAGGGRGGAAGGGAR